MLYLDRLTIHNFKSFKHANISFSKGFNCIVGPNGSGKSNICDALLFSLGELSLKRMRVSSSKNLINSTAKSVKADGIRRAYVTISFTGDENIDISRMIKSNNKVAYRINGKRATRQEILDILKAHKAEINETNTIAQGEIGELLNLSPRERRGMIDIAAGIKEFDDKKEVAMKELGKVDTKITESNIQLGERQAFLSELEKEKADAERYMELSSTSKRIAYTILKARESQIGEEYQKAVDGYEKASNKQKELDHQVKKLDDELASATAYKDSLSKKLNESSIELATANKLIEDASSMIKIKESEKAHIQEAITKSRERIKSLKEEADKISAQKDQNSTSLGSLKAELSDAEKELEALEPDEPSGNSKDLVVKYSEKQKEMEALESRLSSLNAEYVSCNSELSRNEENQKEAKSKLLEAEKERDAGAKELKTLQADITALSGKLETEKNLLSGYHIKLAEFRASIAELDSDMINVRESLAMSGKSTDRITVVLKSEIKKGFYGRAAELCSYDDKYAVAVYAAASSRLNYFVVDSVDVASQAIEIIKARNLGRASFIPLKEILAQGPVEKNGLEPLIKNVAFDEKYKRAFEYIFSNTYLVDKISSANRKGAGKNRLVTLEGELVEQSGIVTGGRLAPQQLPAVLEAKLNKLSNERKAITGKISDIEKEWEQKRKSVATMEIETADLTAKAKYVQVDYVRSKEAIEALSGSISEILARVMTLTKSKEGFAGRKIEVEKEKEKLKVECDGLYAALNKSVGHKSSSSKGSADRLKTLRESIENLKVNMGSLAKETEIREERSRSISKELKEEEASIKGSKKKVEEADSVIEEQEKKRAEIKESIKNRSESSDSLLKDLQTSEDKMSKMGFQKGKISSDISKLEKDIIETESKRSQMQTRLSDIKAELLSYNDVETVQFKEITELEAQQLGCKHEMELLGNVNLKAPEAYTQRKKDVDEANQKLGTLNKEKESILSMVAEIESRRLSVFNETFGEVNENFKKLYSSIFDSTAYLYIDTPTDPFNAKLLFNIQTATRKHTEEELSGGQKSLVMFALLFAIQMRKPMSFYLYDEIDIALDKENSKKLSKLIKELSKNSQFVVVSHNDSLITMAEAAIGVAKQENQSHVVGIEITNKQSVV
jgi:chromosome segregation protein